MNTLSRLATAAALALAHGLCAAELLPIEDFARIPFASSMRLSPDGQRVAYLHEEKDLVAPFFLELSTSAVSRFMHTGPDGSLADVWGIQWVGPRRLMYGARGSTYAIDADGKHWRALTGFDRDPMHPSNVLRAYEIIYLFKDGSRDALMLEVNRSWHRPHVIRLNTSNGAHRRVVDNPGNVVGWCADRNGVVRLGVTRTGLKYGALYRENEKAPWHKLDRLGSSGGIWPLGFDFDNKRLLVSSGGAGGPRALCWFDPATETLSEPLLAVPGYDIVAPDFIPEVSGEPLTGAIFSNEKRTVAGVRYVAEGPRVQWLDPDYAALQAGLDAAMPNHANLIIGRSDSEQQLLILSTSDRDPGTYYFLDRKEQKLKPLCQVRPWLKPEQMADMFPIQYAARDGLTIHGYLTLPPGHGKKNLPVVVMPHGGPWARDVWGFDPLVQMLANRGYAVLQMNYRGSTGYGDDFMQKGRREIGRAIQTDIEDGARWLIAQGIADPKRMAIVGASYGGYSALYALGRSEGLYRCGISIAGVTDWFRIIKGAEDPDDESARLYWEEQVGEPKNDEAFLKEISPVNFADKITAPLLIIQGERDERVPPKQARLMIRALEKNGHRPESYFMSRAGHDFGDAKERLELFKRIEQFLAANMTPTESN